MNSRSSVSVTRSTEFIFWATTSAPAAVRAAAASSNICPARRAYNCFKSTSRPLRSGPVVVIDMARSVRAYGPSSWG